jgi:hypothetical protein
MFYSSKIIEVESVFGGGAGRLAADAQRLPCIGVVPLVVTCCFAVHWPSKRLSKAEFSGWQQDPSSISFPFACGEAGVSYADINSACARYDTVLVPGTQGQLRLEQRDKRILLYTESGCAVQRMLQAGLSDSAIEKCCVDSEKLARGATQQSRRYDAIIPNIGSADQLALMVERVICK